MPTTKKKDALVTTSRKLAAVSGIVATLSLAVFSLGPCAMPEWKFVTKAEAADVHARTDQRIGVLSQSLSRIEGKLDALIQMTREILGGEEQ